MIAGCNDAHLRPVFQLDRVGCPGYCVVGKFYSYKSSGHAACLLLDKHILPDEFRLVKFAENAQPGHYRGDAFRKFISVQGHTRFESERVSAPESAGLYSCVNESGPELAAQIM